VAIEGYTIATTLFSVATEKKPLATKFLEWQ